MIERVLYDCGICSCYHPWSFDGDCRDNDNRFDSPEEYESVKNLPLGSVEVRDWPKS